MRSTFFYLLILALTGLTNCKDSSFLGMGNRTSVEGRVFDKVSRRVVPNAFVFIRSKDRDVEMAWYRTDTFVQADARGNFKIVFQTEEGRDYNVIAKKENFDNAGLDIDINRGNKNKLDLDLQPYGWVKFLFKNTPPYDRADVAVNNLSLYSIQDDTEGIVKVRGGLTNRLVVWVIRPDKTQERTILDLFCPALDTTSYTLNY